MRTFYELYCQRRDERHGGQHRTPVGVSTFDDETNAERLERHRRAYEALGESMPEPLPPMGEYCYRVNGAEPLPPDDDWLRDFERAIETESSGYDVGF